MKKISLALLALGFLSINFQSCTTDPCKDKSATTLCSGRGTLVSNTNSCDCSCDAGYEGTDCSTLSRAKVVGPSWTVTKEVEESSPTTAIPNDPFIRIINEGSSTAKDQITINNFSGISGATVNATIKNNTITIPNQNFGTSYTVSGSATYTALSSNRFTIDIKYTLVRTSDQKKYNYTGIWSR